MGTNEPSRSEEPSPGASDVGDRREVPAAFAGFSPDEAPAGVGFIHGKVRDIFVLDRDLVISASDRISAFDRNLGLIPRKGEILTQLSAFWFGELADICPNHLVSLVGPRAMHVRRCSVIPVEVVVRGYLTGSAWRDYQNGQPVSGIALPAGMRANQQFATPLITPSTKEAVGAHDRPISATEVVESGIVDAARWTQIEQTALALFARGTEICARGGLMLVDTKYEFGLRDGELTLVDEVHTPDSSRFWFADDYAARFAAGEPQRALDKEHLRAWLLERGYQGEGDPPAIPDYLFAEVAERYQFAFETITGIEFSPDETNREAQRQKTLFYVAELHRAQSGGISD
ncbi:MAG: phosphoribosylaminoimidazolesuccinocarboxamide synthase [Spirochaetaceae bacterium]|nr:MAG: phosphoribosylaminoimidazolesuccinocarboxamide synthase [Spirochaetaceae bacterium]